MIQRDCYRKCRGNLDNVIVNISIVDLILHPSQHSFGGASIALAIELTWQQNDGVIMPNGDGIEQQRRIDIVGQRSRSNAF